MTDTFAVTLDGRADAWLVDAPSATAAVSALTGQLKRDLARFLRPRLLILDLCEAPSYVEFVPPTGDRLATLTIGTQHN